MENLLYSPEAQEARSQGQVREDNRDAAAAGKGLKEGAGRKLLRDAQADDPYH